MKFATKSMLGFLATMATVLAVSGGGCSTSSEGLGVDFGDDLPADDGTGAGGGFGNNGGGVTFPVGGEGGDAPQGGSAAGTSGGGSGGLAGATGGSNAAGAAGSTNAGGGGGTMNNAGSGGSTNAAGSGGSNTAGTGGSAMGGTGGMPDGNEGTYNVTPTQNVVVCGDTTCNGNQVCCLSQVPRCVNHAHQCSAFVTRACDERSDCEGAEICCAGAHGDGFRSLCISRNQCDRFDAAVELCANRSQCGDNRLCCEDEIEDMTVGICKSNCG